MNSLKGTLTIGIVLLAGVFSPNAIAYDPGEFSWLWVHEYGYIDDDLYVDGYFDLIGYLMARGGASVADDLDVGGDLDVDGDIGMYSAPRGFFDWVIACSVASFQCDTGVSGDLGVSYDADIGGDLTVYGKTNHLGGVDPPYVLYDRQTRQEIIDRIKREVPPAKQGGAALFFNKEAKRLETYIPREGKFYDLAGNLVHALARIELPTTRYEVAYYLDNSTGEVKTSDKRVTDRYVIKQGYKLDAKTGQFVNAGTGEVVSGEEALELYAASEGNYYDLEGNLIRSEPSEQEIEYRTEYYFDSSTGEIKVRQQAVRDRYVIKRGFSFDKKTGEFINIDTGEAVPKEAAIELKKG